MPATGHSPQHEHTITLEQLKSQLPDYAKDLRLNLDSVLSAAGAGGLDGKQIRAVALAAAIVSCHAPLTRAAETFVAEQLTAQEREGVKAAAAIMAMNNIYYRATHMIANVEYGQLRPGLRMNVMANPGLDKLAFELAVFAVSAINGCGKCMDSHERTLRQHGVSATVVQGALKIAAVMHAVAVTLEQQTTAA